MLELVIAFLVKSTVILALALSICGLKRLSAAERHAVAGTSLVAVAILAVLTLLTDHVRVPRVVGDAAGDPGRGCAAAGGRGEYGRCASGGHGGFAGESCGNDRLAALGLGHLSARCSGAGIVDARRTAKGRQLRAPPARLAGTRFHVGWRRCPGRRRRDPLDLGACSSRRRASPGLRDLAAASAGLGAGARTGPYPSPRLPDGRAFPPGGSATCSGSSR